MRHPLQVFVLALSLAGCNDSLHVAAPSQGASTSAPTEAMRDPQGEKPRERSSRDSEASAAPSTDVAPEADPSGFDQDMAKIVLERGRKQAVQCPQVAKNTPTGEGEIQVLFDGPTGRIVDVDLGPTFNVGSAVGQACLKAAFVGQIVTNFQGRKKLSYTLTVPQPEPSPKDSSKAKEGKKGP